ncbi:MAG: PKD domain-containing protein [Daejeonella sp.]
MLILLFSFCAFAVKAQNTSNKGKDFWLGYGNHVRGYFNNSQQMSVYVTSDVSTTGKIEIPGINYSRSFNVTANSITIVDVPQQAYLGGEGLFNLGIHISAEKPIVMYAHIYDKNVSGATLVLPTSTLGKDYYSINFTQVSNQPQSYSYFFVIAVEDNTQVEIVPSANTQLHQAGVPFTVNLRKGEVYQVLGVSTNSSAFNKFNGVDLTGSTIKSVSSTSESCKPIAVFSGSGKIAIGCGESETESSDNLYQQVYPTAAWGKKFITAPLKARNYDIIRVLRSDPSSVVKVNGTVINNNQFTNNFFYQFSSQEPNVIESDKPIQVVQYAVTQGKEINCGFFNEPAGDPEMICLNSVEQNIDNITVYSSSAFAITSHFINVVIESDAAASFKLDGFSSTLNFKPINGQPDYSYAQIPVGAGVHNLRADKGFNAIAYGFGQAESYGYSAGANVNNLGIQIKSLVSDSLTLSGCVAEPLRFEVNLHYQPTKLTWQLRDGSEPRVIENPAYDSTFVKDGVSFYVYQLKDTIRYFAAGDFVVDVTSEKPSADGCGSSEQLVFEFSIFNAPLSKFNVNEAVCEGEIIQFTDQSDGQGRELTSWLWDFGDPASGEMNFSTEQNPSHVYNNFGEFPVKLTVTNNSNCEPVVSEIKTVAVYQKPKSLFTVSGQLCANNAVSFEDKSTSGNQQITKWNWFFADGETSSEQNPNHIYSQPGDYLVKLITENAGSCISDTFSMNVSIGKVPVVDFETPEICLADAVAKFKNETAFDDGGDLGITYLWNFGDGNANPSNPGTSTAKDPSHTYRAAGNYTVNMTATTANGCVYSKAKTFTVNGSIPKADFTVVNANNLCSSDSVYFEDRSTVDFGQLTKIEWYFDNTNQPALIFTDEEPALRSDSPKRYSFQYPVFHTPGIKTFAVKMLAYSGIVCVSEQIKTITLKAVPEILFDSIPGICIDGNPVQITQARENAGFTGSGTYSGAGITSEGLFTPQTAGLGEHLITYTFVGANSCPSSESRIINVYNTPLADAGEDQVVLEGGQIRIPARAEGDNLFYKWTPNIALNRDDVLNPVASPVEDITYTLEVFSAEGCKTVDQVFIKVLKTPVIPNTFTPNNDGFNDLWNIKYLESYPDVQIDIFNRYGVKVYNSMGYTSAWDGKFRNIDLPVGTYYYIIDPKNGRKQITGSVTIIR